MQFNVYTESKQNNTTYMYMYQKGKKKKEETNIINSHDGQSNE